MDNQSSIQIASTTAFLQRSKHIRLKFFHIRALVLSGQLELRYVQSEYNTADCMTKALQGTKFYRHVFGADGFRHLMEHSRPDDALALHQLLDRQTIYQCYICRSAAPTFSPRSKDAAPTVLVCVPAN
jgi:hypothetical protein